MYKWMGARDWGQAGGRRERSLECRKGLSQENIYPKLQVPEAISVAYEQKKSFLKQPRIPNVPLSARILFSDRVHLYCFTKFQTLGTWL